MRFYRLAALFLLLMLAGGSVAGARDISVWAAASLTESLQKIALLYEKKSGARVVFNFGSSSTLARQIEEGAPADLFFSADEAKMDALQAKGKILNDTRRTLLSNSLVIVTAPDRSLIQTATDLTAPSVKRIALAEPHTVPAGIYAKNYLERQNLWPVLVHKVIPTQNVRAALAAVESGNADVAIVYKTDARISRKVKVAFEISGADTPDIRYPVAALKETEGPARARDFIQFLQTPTAAAVFKEFGFGVID